MLLGLFIPVMLVNMGVIQGVNKNIFYIDNKFKSIYL